MTTLFHAAGNGSAKACWARMHQAGADRFESASSAAIHPPSQAVRPWTSTKPDRYWSAPRRAKSPAIPIIEIGYVRRSEVILYELDVDCVVSATGSNDSPPDYRLPKPVQDEESPTEAR